MKPALFPLMRIGILAFSYLYATSEIANAQVTPDGTVNTQVNPSGSVSEINGGETRGDNLFHSFQEFSVRTGNEAFFDNAAAIKNIFSRVTGGNVSNIDASSEFGLDGTVSITILEPDAIQGTAELPINVVQPQETTEQTCAVNQETGKTNGLTIKGKGGVPPAPDLPLTANNIMINGNDVTSEVERQEELTPSATNPIMIDGKEIIPARGVVKTKDGGVILTAYPTSGESSRVPAGSANCARS
jgi:filamentous hemagglutinin family protein